MRWTAALTLPTRAATAPGVASDGAAMPRIPVGETRQTHIPCSINHSSTGLHIYRGQSVIPQEKEGTAMKTRHTLYALALAGWVATLSASHVCALEVRKSMVLDRDYNEQIVIAANYVNLDCNFHKISGPGSASAK